LINNAQHTTLHLWFLHSAANNMSTGTFACGMTAMKQRNEERHSPMPAIAPTKHYSALAESVFLSTFRLDLVDFET